MEYTSTAPGAGASGSLGATEAEGGLKGAAGQATEQTKQAASQAKGVVRTQVDERSTKVGEQVATQAGDLRSVSEQLREQGKDAPARIAEQAADRVERVGGYLRDNDADRLMSDVEDFARRNPWAVAFGGLALGFAASRMLKASSSDRYKSGRSTSASRGYGAGNGYTLGAPSYSVGATEHATTPTPAASGGTLGTTGTGSGYSLAGGVGATRPDEPFVDTETPARRDPEPGVGGI